MVATGRQIDAAIRKLLRRQANGPALLRRTAEQIEIWSYTTRTSRLPVGLQARIANNLGVLIQYFLNIYMACRVDGCYNKISFRCIFCEA